MQEANIPTANFWKVNSLEEAKKIINLSPIPLVVKADGLASGKGVFIPDSKEECIKATESIFNGKFGNSGNVVVLEEKFKVLKFQFLLYVMEEICITSNRSRS